MIENMLVNIKTSYTKKNSEKHEISFFLSFTKLLLMLSNTLISKTNILFSKKKKKIVY